MNKKWIKLTGLVVLFTAFYLGIKGYGQEALELMVDQASFRYDARALFVEIYYSVHQPDISVLKDKKAGDSWVIKMDMHVDRNDTVWVENSWSVPIKIEKPIEQGMGANMVGRAYFAAPAGFYKVKITARDPEIASSIAEVQFERDVIPYPTDQLAISDIEMASSIEFNAKEDQSNPFYKNSLSVIPHPSLVYGGSNNILYYYIEIYNVLSGISGNQYIIESSIIDMDGKLTEGIQPIKKRKEKGADSIVDVGEVGLFNIPTGSYYLLLRILDSENKELALQKKKFYIYDPSRMKADNRQLSFEEEYNMSIFSKMEEEQLSRDFEYIKYLVNEDTKKIYNRCNTAEAKRQFLFKFWKSMDPEPATAENEFYTEYMKRIIYSNMNFSNMREEGWQSDRGRVYITYGPPSDVERSHSTSGMAPHEIWQYDTIEGGVDFVFADLSGYKVFVLIHSTKKGEVYNPDFENVLERGF